MYGQITIDSALSIELSIVSFHGTLILNATVIFHFSTALS